MRPIAKGLFHANFVRKQGLWLYCGHANTLGFSLSSRKPGQLGTGVIAGEIELFMQQ